MAWRMVLEPKYGKPEPRHMQSARSDLTQDILARTDTSETLFMQEAKMLAGGVASRRRISEAVP